MNSVKLNKFSKINSKRNNKLKNSRKRKNLNFNKNSNKKKLKNLKKCNKNRKNQNLKKLKIRLKHLSLNIIIPLNTINTNLNTIQGQHIRIIERNI